MPCHRPDGFAFPAFPADFESDTRYFHQALAEHNYLRVDCGLPTKTFPELSRAEQTDVLGCAQTIKLESRARAEVTRLTLVPAPARNERLMFLAEQEHVDSSQRFRLLAAAALLLAGAICIYIWPYV
jgi:hypothetical protein